MRIICDTNFFLIPHQFKVDIFSEFARLLTTKYEICALSKTVDELEKIQVTLKGKDKLAAKLGLIMLQEYKVKILPTPDPDKTVDENLVDLAKKQEVIIATVDKEVRDAVHQAGNKVIILRQKQYLAFYKR